MYVKTLLKIAIILNISPVYAQSNMQKGIYDAAEEMIRFDEKMNQAIAEHNQFSIEDEEEMRLNSMVEDFEETKNGYRLERTIPNPKNSDVLVKLDEGTLTISITTTENSTLDAETNISFESSISSTTVSLFLPTDADENKMQKTYQNGVLTITFPKK